MPDETQGTQTWVAGLSIGLTFACLAAWSCGRWTDPQLDFGNELYIAWQLSEGKALYADIAHRNGPLSHYWNAFLFRGFGASMSTLVWANLAVLAACCALAFGVLRRFADVLGATLGVLGLLAIFAFGQYLDVANYNFVTPYHHFQTHGIALGLLLVLALTRSFERGTNTWPAVAGACFGALLLTKLELWLPGLVASAAAIALWFNQRPAAAVAWTTSFTLATFAVTGAVFFALLSAMPAGMAANGMLGNLNYLGDALAHDAFYRSGAGLDAIGPNTLLLCMASLCLACVGAGIAGVDRALAGRSISPRAYALIGIALCAALAGLVAPQHWLAVAAVLPIFSVATAATAAARCARAGVDDAEFRSSLALCLFALWATALLAKLFLAPRFHHYGFALAMPATLLLIAVSVSRLPALARRIGGDGRFARVAAIAVSVALMLGCLRVSAALYAHKTLAVGPAGDAMLVDSPARAPRGKRLDEFRRALEARLPPEATLLVYPEGAQLNYWLRRSNPSRYLLFLPTELDAFGRDEIRADLRAAAPDFVALLHRGHAEFGVGAFGEDPQNGRGIVSWVRDEYELIERIGPPPFRARGFGAELWRRKPAAPGTRTAR